MYISNLDDAVKNVKTIVENNRCGFCDQLNASTVRYACGHSTCSNCVETAENCLLCLTQPDAPAHFIDEPSRQRAKNASELLIAFQELFEIDVYRRTRISEKLKLEKELFPECIQASSKYYNKRKSLKASGKENKRISSLPGETISVNKLLKMENTVNYVENWLNKNESVQTIPHKNLPRKPFSNLNVNITKNRDANNLGFQISNTKSVNRKRTHFKVIKPNTSNVSKISSKRFKYNTNIKKYGKQSSKKNISENNESGIFIDDDTIDIEDSECETMDKDSRALLEVFQAEKNDNSVDCGIESLMNENENKTKDSFEVPNKRQDALKTYKVPFFKKSTLANVCNSKTENVKDITKNLQTSKNVTVTIDNDKFVTTIKLSNVAEGPTSSKKQSTATQTDNISDNEIISNNTEKNFINEPITVVSQDRIMDVKSNDVVQVCDSGIGLKHKCLIIEESDSDSDLAEENITSLEVIAEVHQSDTYVGRGVLCELEQNDFANRTKHAVRELTPLSSDSSDKENYDPNRIKRQKTEKKSCMKK